MNPIVSLTSRVVQWAADNTEDIPQDVLDRLPDDVVRQLRNGIIDRIPEDVLDGLPADLVGRIPPGLIDFAGGNPAFAAVLAIIGVLAVIGFIFGVMKSAIKVTLFSLVAGAAAWYFFFQNV